MEGVTSILCPCICLLESVQLGGGGGKRPQGCREVNDILVVALTHFGVLKMCMGLDYLRD